MPAHKECLYLKTNVENGCYYNKIIILQLGFGFGQLFLQGQPLGNGYYTRQPVKCTVRIQVMQDGVSVCEVALGRRHIIK